MSPGKFATVFLPFYVASVNLIIPCSCYLNSNSEKTLDKLKQNGSHMKNLFQHATFVLKSTSRLSIIQLADKYNFTQFGSVANLPHVFYFERENGPHRYEAFEQLLTDENIEWADLQFHRPRKRSWIYQDFGPRYQEDKPFGPCYWKDDPLYCHKQWHLWRKSFHMRVQQAWEMGYSGKGIVISVLDDGISKDHPDLAPNYCLCVPSLCEQEWSEKVLSLGLILGTDGKTVISSLLPDPMASTDINANDTDPTPRISGSNTHGTRCAGEIAAVAGNRVCGVGIAFNSRIGGVRMLDGDVTDAVEAAALSFNQDHIDIYSVSWGPVDSGEVLDGPGPLAKVAFKRGIETGRNGKGNIFVWASGDGGNNGDSCSCDGYVVSIYTVAISSTDRFHQVPWYLEECPATLATTYSSSTSQKWGITTTDTLDGCTNGHTGTSASAPLAAGIIALALEANKELTWRDVQHLIVRTSDSTYLNNSGRFKSNGVKRPVSDAFGYGLMNSEAMVKLARTWNTVPKQINCTVENDVDRRVSVLLTPRERDPSDEGFHDWPFMSVQQWGENPIGVWTLIAENSDHNETAHLQKWSLTLYGTSEDPQPSIMKQVNGVNNTGGTTFVALLQAKPLLLTDTYDKSILFETCHNECNPMFGCYARDSPDHCVFCQNYQLEIFDNRRRPKKRCLPTCGHGYYAKVPNEDGQKICRPCQRGCRTCLDQDQCLSCGFGVYLWNQTCISVCPNGFLEQLQDGLGVCEQIRPLNTLQKQGSNESNVIILLILVGMTISCLLFCLLTWRDRCQKIDAFSKVYAASLPTANIEFLRSAANRRLIGGSFENLYNADDEDMSDSDQLLFKQHAVNLGGSGAKILADRMKE